MKKSLLTEALTIARSKLSIHPEGKRYLHYTFVCQYSKLVEWGFNHRGIPPIHMGYHRRISDLKFRPKIHSELSAYKKSRGLLDKRKPFNIINIRLNRDGEFRNSRPCSCCYNLLKSLGCDKFYFTDICGFEITR